MDCRLSNEKVGNWNAMPHAVMMSQITLESLCLLEDIRRWSGCPEGFARLDLLSVVVPRRTRRVEQLKFTHWADVEDVGKFDQLAADDRIVHANQGTFIDDLTACRHISSDDRTSMSTWVGSVSRKARR